MSQHNSYSGYQCLLKEQWRPVRIHEPCKHAAMCQDRVGISAFLAYITAYSYRRTGPNRTQSKLYNFRSHRSMVKCFTWWRQMETFPRYWPFVQGIHRSSVNSPHKGQWHGDLMFSLIWAWINGWVNNREAGDLRRHLAHYDVTAMNGHELESGGLILPSTALKLSGCRLNIKMSSYQYRDPSFDRLIFNIGTLIPEIDGLYIETALSYRNRFDHSLTNSSV